MGSVNDGFIRPALALPLSQRINILARTVKEAEEFDDTLVIEHNITGEM